MKFTQFTQLLQGPTLCAEVRADSFHLHNGVTGEDLAITTGPDGRWDAASQARVREAFGRLAPRKPWQPRGALLCALPGRGVSLRKVRLPVHSRDNLRRLLALQVEAEFPLAPDALAWGWLEPDGKLPSMPSAGGLREFVVAAVKKEAVDDLSALFDSVGFDPVFTLAAMVRGGVSEQPAPSRTVLEIGRHTTEILTYQDGLPAFVRAISLGSQDILAVLDQDTGLPPARVEQLAPGQGLDTGMPSERREALLGRVATALAPVVTALQRLGCGAQLEVFGETPAAALGAQALTAAFPATVVLDRVEPNHLPGTTAAVNGLRRVAQPPGGDVPLRLEAKPSAANFASRRGWSEVPWKWVARAAALLVALLLFPYAEALTVRPFLSRRLAALRKERVRLEEIDRRLEFLQYMTDNQPPYIDATYMIAKVAPPGLRIESLTMNRRGEIALGGFAQMPQQVVDFRSKLADSGYFSHIAVEEQAPVQPGQPRTLLRITGQWRGAAEREALQIGPPLPEPAGSNAPASVKMGGTNTPTATTNPPAKH